MIGTLGPITFSVSESEIKTFSDLKLNHSAKYSEHSITGRKGLLEFTGFNVDTINLKIIFDYKLNVNPLQELKILRKIFVNRNVVDFVLDGKPIGENQWVVTDLNEELEDFTSDGKLIRATVNITLKEYIQLEEEGD